MTGGVATGVACPRCGSDNPGVASFCYRCGQALRHADRSRSGRGGSYAVQPSEGVAQLALISTIMPHSTRRVADNYRWALLLGGGLVVLLTLLGLISAAILAAAFLVPATYLLYIYDVNLWEDTPAPAVAVLFLFTGVLSFVVSLLLFHVLFKNQFLRLLAASGPGGGFGDLPIGSLLVFAVALPLVAEVAKNAGPVILARRPAFDDMIDGFTFGVASGTAYAAFETVVAFGAVFAGPVVQTGSTLTWLVVILNLMVVKSLVYGSATGIAVAAFSGRGEGYDGFTPSYAAHLALAVGANVAYWLGVRLLAYAPFGQALGLVWGLVVASVLLLRVRFMLQAALLEAAVEAAADERRPVAATTDGGFCPECEFALLPDSLFCIACGASVRATSTAGRRTIRQPLVEQSTK